MSEACRLLYMGIAPRTVARLSSPVITITRPLAGTKSITKLEHLCRSRPEASSIAGTRETQATVL